MGRWLITGGSGSFGTALIRTLLATRPDVTVVSVSRNAEMRYRLEQLAPPDRLEVVPGDVRVLDDLRPAFDRGVDVIIHAAAEKHIGTGEKYQHYATSINVEGAYNVIALAREYRVPAGVALSTDKACDPCNIYGHTKAIAEAAFVAAPTPWAVVRYGNVVGSSGSVIPLFLRQRVGRVLTVTDRRMTRFWMPLADPPYCDMPVYQEPDGRPVMSAVRWVLLAVGRGRGGEIFVPKIPSARVEDVARAVCPDAEIVEVGIRPGEKLHEDLISPEEARRTWANEFGGWTIAPPKYPVHDLAPWSYRSDQDCQPIRVDGLL